MNVTNDSSILPVLVWLFPVLASAFLLWLWRGRRVPCPPSCRRCGYDVSQRPSDSTKCSECGSDLNAPRAITTHQRHRGGVITYAALVLFFASVGWFAHVGQQFEWVRWYLFRAPDRWLEYHASRPGNKLAKDSFEHWLFRYESGKLDAAKQSRFFDHLLAWQADTGRVWDPAAADLLHEAMLKEKLTEVQEAQLVRGAFAGVELVPRSPIRVGDPVPFAVRFSEFRGRSRNTPQPLPRGAPRTAPGIIPARPQWLWARGSYASFTGPPEVSPPNRWGWGYGAISESGYTWASLPKEAGTVEISPGKHRLHLAVGIAFSAMSDTSKPITPIVEFRQTAEVEVLPAGTPIGIPIEDPELKHAAAVVSPMKVGIYRWRGGRIFAEVSLGSAPVDRAFEIFLDHDGTRHRIGRRYARAFEGNLHQSQLDYVPVPDSPDVESMTLVLVGSGEGLVNSPDQERYWPGVITFPDLALRPEKESYGQWTGPPPPHRVSQSPDPPKRSTRPTTRPAD